jgi:uncharacterized membrane protein YoaK (UPF0700 family)
VFAEPARQAPDLDRDHLPPEHSDAGLMIGEYLAALGGQVGGTAVLESALVIMAFQSGLTRRDYTAWITGLSVISPLLMALPSSYFASNVSRRCVTRRHSWAKSFVAGLVVSTVETWAAAAFATGGFEKSSKNHAGSAELVLIGGSLLAPLAEVLTFNFAQTDIVPAPMILKDGGGFALGLSF